ncbi:unnamed protein product [Rhodiola kirilowii]
MESEKKEALKAKETAERMFMERNYLGAKGYALKPSLCVQSWMVFHKWWPLSAFM